ncbi:response regulator transcription factor [Ruminiclostridium cellobioparum]|uniref:Stage 0 sporulation protein A homolog n=1 Tax=Ruminiclostridium cellobioparum subsp. termitidis CT1112 TaxID=1195236 RepID=S0FK53_RUMCE|nr:response regulator transcription factor [Ruminiclostridium cellobioparum]EMS69539.1 two component transcriptional regulator, LuxR family [Ruminiclostridium cellobioparum subsp. termitidis CT1112]
MIKVMIADDQVVVREGLKKILSLDPEIQVVSEAGNGYEALSQLGEHIVDVILMDVRMPKMDGIQATGKIKAQYPKVKIIILTTFNEDEYLFNGIKSGISGYLLKDSDVDFIIKSIKNAYQDKMIFDPDVTPKLIKAINAAGQEHEPPPAIDGLTERERQIVNLIAKGQSNLEIANALFISEGTVKNAVSKILNKLNLQRRTQLLALFHKK